MTPARPPAVSDEDLDRLSLIVSERTGVTFSESDDQRRERMRRVVAELARESGEGGAQTLRRLLSTSRQAVVDLLAPYVTIGETYFFRESRSLEIFRDRVVPLLSRERRGPLRIWCAGCSSGEEPYTLAMLLGDAAPAGRGISLFGTDINARALEKARRALYTRWSLRGLDGERTGRFFEGPDGGPYSVRPRYRSGVSFSLFNLVDPGPFPWGEGTVDVVFCRNVLIYFDAATREGVLDLFHRALSPAGWLVVAPCEVSALLASRFCPRHFDGVTLYCKEGESSLSLPPEEPFWGDVWERPADEEEGEAASPEPSFTEGLALWEGPGEKGGGGGPDGTPDGLQAVRRLADEGRLDEALALCLAGDDRSDPARYYLLATIHQERGDVEAAQSALRRVLYLDPSFVAGHYGLGALALRRDRHDEARRHFRNAADLLAKMAPEAPVAESGGMTAAEFRSMMEASRL
ncbi:hypothetical protein KAR29_05550 [Aminithiophilus ramosus]|uniref:CheR-type methyltransferase domain-containing protein n=2 Tax=Synergistales TaxID=649776 RepID=A0A9Q7EX44_9BACT|nr:protein-glutamate O-methyltransferase CheR [Aminithiophilus ramosus]QTX33339.1 hypothetical protein KAR29_05550 [Aminithiophilus ramosus]QVL36913.1 hypothetical protein KIH16_03810 [Synergistota bacterium]